jgi:hypothetical protein
MERKTIKKVVVILAGAITSVAGFAYLYNQMYPPMENEEEVNISDAVSTSDTSM